MKLTSRQLRNIILQETVSLMKAPAAHDHNQFLHGFDDGHPQDDEGGMVKSRMYSMKKMAADVCSLLDDDDQLPGWVQDHISVAHENLRQVHGYLMGENEKSSQGMSAMTSESRRNKMRTMKESHARITREEMEAWNRGEWGFNSEDE